MAAIWKLSGTCPACGTGGQRIGLLGSIKRSCALMCRRCETPLYSDIAWGQYLIFVLYSQLIALVLAPLMIFSLLGGAWLMAALALCALLVLLILPGMALHARVMSTRFDL